jgi:5-formyltetrahydrofolate cyclo-ligase
MQRVSFLLIVSLLITLQDFNILDKNELRRKFLQIRKNISSDQKKIMDKKILNNFFMLDEIKEKSKFLFYYSLPYEVSTLKIIEKLIDEGKKIALPKVEKNEGLMNFYYISDINNDVHKGAYSIFEPNENFNKVSINEIDLIIVPGVVFDRKGSRIGFGKGYYDKFLNQFHHITKIALTYSVQISEFEIITDKHDVIMDYIITEHEVIKIK